MDQEQDRFERLEKLILKSIGGRPKTGVFLVGFLGDRCCEEGPFGFFFPGFKWFCELANFQKALGQNLPHVGRDLSKSC